MNTRKSPNKWISLSIVILLFLSPSLLQGCDAFGSLDEEPAATTHFLPGIADSKFRHVELLDQARTFTSPESADKNGRRSAQESTATPATVHLVIGVTEYAASGVTPRMLSRYDVTRRLINKYGEDINIKTELDNAIHAITIEIDESLLSDLFDELNSDSDVAWVEPDVKIPPTRNRSQSNAPSSQEVPWGVNQVGSFMAAYTPGRTQVYVLDSGVSESNDINLASAADMVGFYDQRNGEYVSYEKVPDGRESRDRIGHGTHIAGTIGAKHNSEGIIGVAPGVPIHSVRVLGKDGGTDITTLLSAIEYVMYRKSEKPDYPVVVNMSLGANIGTTSYNALDEAIANAIEAGIVFVLAAGNEGVDVATISPAHVTEAITVGAFGRNMQFSAFSNFGPEVDILAPGEDILSLAHTYSETGYLMLSNGTSHATPHVTGLVIRYLDANPDATPAEVEQAIKQSAQDLITGQPSGTTSKAVFLTN